jgi:excisionase family DNA binding protein
MVQFASRPAIAGTEPEVVASHRSLSVEPYLTTEQIISVLAISRATLNRWIDRGFPVHGRGTGRHLRFRMSEVDRWMSKSDVACFASAPSTLDITG